jgi:hypothetical protein
LARQINGIVTGLCCVMTFLSGWLQVKDHGVDGEGYGGFVPGWHGFPHTSTPRLGGDLLLNTDSEQSAAT